MDPITRRKLNRDIPGVGRRARLGNRLRYLEQDGKLHRQQLSSPEACNVGPEAFAEYVVLGDAEGVCLPTAATAVGAEVRVINATSRDIDIRMADQADPVASLEPQGMATYEAREFALPQDHPDGDGKPRKFVAWFHDRDAADEVDAKDLDGLCDKIDRLIEEQAALSQTVEQQAEQIELLEAAAKKPTTQRKSTSKAGSSSGGKGKSDGTE